MIITFLALVGNCGDAKDSFSVHCCGRDIETPFEKRNGVEVVSLYGQPDHVLSDNNVNKLNFLPTTAIEQYVRNELEGSSDLSLKRVVARFPTIMEYGKNIYCPSTKMIVMGFVVSYNLCEVSLEMGFTDSPNYIPLTSSTSELSFSETSSRTTKPPVESNKMNKIDLMPSPADESACRNALDLSVGQHLTSVTLDTASDNGLPLFDETWERSTPTQTSPVQCIIYYKKVGGDVFAIVQMGFSEL